MVKHYTLLTNVQRQALCRLIAEEGLSIKEASLISGIPYPNAKAVYKTFRREYRSDKKHSKYQEIQSVKKSAAAEITLGESRSENFG